MLHFAYSMLSTMNRNNFLHNCEKDDRTKEYAIGESS